MDPKHIYHILQIVGMIALENVMSLVDVKLVRMELDYQTVKDVSKHNAGKTSQCGSLL